MAAYRNVQTDVLIVGGGGAAVRAAIAADEAGTSVAMLVKGQVAHSGLTAMACPSYQAAGAFEEQEDTPEIAFGDAAKEGRYLGDENLIRVLVDEATERAHEMERFGVKLTRTKDGRIFQVMHPGQSYARNLVIRGCGYGMMVGLRRELLRRPRIQTFEDFVATRLLKDGDRIAGAVALNLRTGELVVFQARSTIMATGGYEEIMEFTDTEPGASGDGTALALQAGANMVDLEMMLFYPTCLVWPDEVRGTLVQYEGLLGPRYLQGKMLNGLGQEFLPETGERYVLPVRDTMMKSMFKEIDEGRGSPHGGVYIDLRPSPRSHEEIFSLLHTLVDKLLVNFTWWVNREDADGSNVFEGGFLGLDNIGPIDRSHLLPGQTLQQSDATAWMAFYSLTMAGIAAILDRHGRDTSDLVVKFLEHFSLISDAMEAQGLWDEEDGFYYDRLRSPDGSTIPVRVASMVGVLPADGVRGHRRGDDRARADAGQADRAPARAPAPDARRAGGLGAAQGASPGTGPRCWAWSTRRICCGSWASSSTRRPSSRPMGCARCHAGTGSIPTTCRSTAWMHRSTTSRRSRRPAMFGGNSNWRGPIWFPVNYLIVNALLRFSRYSGDSVTIEYPTGSGEQHTLQEVGEDIRRRLISLFLVGEDGRRPCFGWVDKLQRDPAWKDNLLFHEYFHGDDGAGLGASHQTGLDGRSSRISSGAAAVRRS